MLYKEEKAHTQIHKLFFKPKHIWMIMEPCVAQKKRMYLSHCLQTYSFTDLSGGLASQRNCVFKNAFKRFLPNI